MKKSLRGLWVGLLPFLMVACEDSGNPGDDSILTGATGVVLIIVALIVVLWLVARNRR